MPNTYALIEIKDTLINEDMDYNLNLINSLLENNIRDVYLFTDSKLCPNDILKLNEVVRVLENKGITVYGIMTTPDLFWAVDPQHLKSFKRVIEENKISIDSNWVVINGRPIYNREENIELLNQYFPGFSALLRQEKLANNIIGSAYRDKDEPDFQERATGAAMAVEIYLKSYSVPGRHVQGFLLKHFMKNKPGDCRNCIIFYNKEENFPGFRTSFESLLSDSKDINLVKIKVKQQDFDEPSATKNYISRIKSILPLSNQGQSALSIASSSAEMQYVDINPRVQWYQSVIDSIDHDYSRRRGFKLFGYSSDESKDLLANLNCKDFNDYAKQTMIDIYMSNNQNKGKRLYDILLEARVRHIARDHRHSPSDNWLTEEMLYLIQQKYKYERGYKIFGYSSPESIEFLNKLNDREKNLAEKQKLIDDYFADRSRIGKRLFNVLREVRNWDDAAARKYEYQHRY